jgi:hypothetical protein
MRVGMFVEDLYCYGFPDGYKLPAERRTEVIEDALRFEECSYPRPELEAMDDSALIAAHYSAMADYARGQV